MTRVLVVSSSASLRSTLESLAEVVAATESVEEGLSLAAELNPDLIIAEASAESDVQELSELVSGSLPVLLLTSETQPASINEVLRGGIRGVLPRDSSATEIGAAIGAVVAGLHVFHPQTADALRSAPSDSGEPLSRREIEVLRLMGEGLSNKIIAWRLNISEHTVKFHVNAILSKLNAGSRTEAVMIGLRRGLVPL